jgi:hypothetical protein
LGKRRWPVERSNAWVLENKRLALRYDRLGFIELPPVSLDIDLSYREPTW